MNTLEKYQIKIESALKESLKNFAHNPTLKKASEYALLNGGKRFRPSIALMVAEALGSNFDISKVALTIEYFHTASLIADDLPCMDNDDFRRDKPSLHKVYGETLSLLVTYALIAEGYRNIYLNAEDLKNNNYHFANKSDQICALALENATFNTGIHGATGGQVFDLNPVDFSLEAVKEIIHKKTTSLFEIAFVFGWLYGGGDIQKVNSVKKIAKHFGLAYQIADDLIDLKEDQINKRSINMANLFGENFAKKLMEEEIENYMMDIHSLGISTTELLSLPNIIKKELI